VRFLPLVLAIVVSTVAFAADEGQGGRADASEADEIGVLKLRPAGYLPAVLMPNAQPPTAPPATDSAVVEKWLESRHGPDGEGKPPEVLSLGPGSLQIAERAFLVLSRPQVVHPQSTVEFAADGGGVATLRLKLRSGQSCLVDFSVSGIGPGRYEIAADSQRRSFEDETGAGRHLLIGLEAEADGWTSIRLQREQGGFHLHAVTVTISG
jgi:hypothetical protein